MGSALSVPCWSKGPSTKVDFDPLGKFHVDALFVLFHRETKEKSQRFGRGPAFRD